MTPTHTNKLGARYRYYASHALQQKRNDEAGTVTRVPAHEIEALVVNALRERLGEPVLGDRELIDLHLERIVIKPEAIEIHLVGEDDVVTVPWAAEPFAEVKGILHSPAARPTMNPENRDALLTAIAKARGWVDDLVKGRATSFEQIAKRERKAERHIRLLAPLAFVSPQIVTAIVDVSAPADLTVTGLAKAVACSWAEQGQRVGPGGQ